MEKWENDERIIEKANKRERHKEQEEIEMLCKVIIGRNIVGERG